MFASGFTFTQHLQCICLQEQSRISSCLHVSAAILSVCSFAPLCFSATGCKIYLGFVLAGYPCCQDFTSKRHTSIARCPKLSWTGAAVTPAFTERWHADSDRIPSIHLSDRYLASDVSNRKERLWTKSIVALVLLPKYWFNWLSLVLLNVLLINSYYTVLIISSF